MTDCKRLTEYAEHAKKIIETLPDADQDADDYIQRKINERRAKATTKKITKKVVKRRQI